MRRQKFVRAASILLVALAACADAAVAPREPRTYLLSSVGGVAIPTTLAGDTRATLGGSVVLTDRGVAIVASWTGDSLHPIASTVQLRVDTLGYVEQAGHITIGPAGCLGGALCPQLDTGTVSDERVTLALRSSPPGLLREYRRARVIDPQ